MCRAYALPMSFFWNSLVLADAGVLPAWLKAWAKMASVFLAK